VSRSGYSDDCDTGALNLYRANVDRALSGKRGQAFLREMAAALDAMPVKELVAEEIVRDSEHVCAIGSVALARQLDVSKLDPEDPDTVAGTFGIARMLACEIAYWNDERGKDRWEDVPQPQVSPDPEGRPPPRPRQRRIPETPAERWTRMRSWVAAHLRGTP
jgi:hypothetical protein